MLHFGFYKGTLAVFPREWMWGPVLASHAREFACTSLPRNRKLWWTVLSAGQFLQKGPDGVLICCDSHAGKVVETRPGTADSVRAARLGFAAFRGLAFLGMIRTSATGWGGARHWCAQPLGREGMLTFGEWM